MYFVHCGYVRQHRRHGVPDADVAPGQPGGETAAAPIRLRPRVDAAFVHRAYLIGIYSGAALQEAQWRKRHIVRRRLVQPVIVLILFPTHGVTPGACTLQKSDGYPRKDSYHDQARQQRQKIAPDRLDPLGPIDAANGAGSIVSHSERRSEQSDTHGEDDDHGIMDLVDADSARYREQQRTKQHNSRNAFKYAP